MRLSISPIVITWGDEPHNIYPFKLGRTTLYVRSREIFHMGLTLPDDSEVPFVMPSTGKDGRGNPTTLKGPITVSVSDPALLKITQPDPATPSDPNSGVLAAVGPVGSAQATFTDTGDSANPLTMIVDVQIISGDTVSLDSPIFGAVQKIPVTAL